MYIHVFNSLKNTKIYLACIKSSLVYEQENRISDKAGIFISCSVPPLNRPSAHRAEVWTASDSGGGRPWDSRRGHTSPALHPHHSGNTHHHALSSRPPSFYFSSSSSSRPFSCL